MSSAAVRVSMVGAIVAGFSMGTSARGDVFIEVTPSTEAPDGLVDTRGIGTPFEYDIWIWGTGPDQLLKGATFNVGAVHTLDVSIGDIGQANPGGQFTFFKNGVIGFLPDTIFDVQVLSIPFGTEIGTTPATATMIYKGFTSTFINPGGALNTSTWALATGGGSNPTVHAIGVVETPTPGAGVLMVLAACGAGRRRGARVVSEHARNSREAESRLSRRTCP